MPIIFATKKNSILANITDNHLNLLYLMNKYLILNLNNPIIYPGFSKLGSFMNLNFKILIILLTVNVFAGEKFENINSKMIRSLDFQSRQTFHNYTIEFFKNVSKEVKLEKNQRYTFIDFLSIDAIAADGTCFYAGYESTLQNNVCKIPNASSSSCKGAKTFTCSPILFGDNACVKNSASSDLVDDCNKASSDKFNQAFENIKKKPEDYTKLVDKIAKYCKENKAAEKSCSVYNSRIKKLEESIKAENEKIIKNAKENAREIQNAHGILEGCKKSYDKENEGFFDAKSNRDILGGISNTLSCHTKEVDIKVANFDELEESIKGIEGIFKLNDQKNLLKEINAKSLELSMDAILATQVSQNGVIDEKVKDQILNQHPFIAKDDSLKIAMENKIQFFKNNKQKIKDALYIPPEKTIESFKNLSTQINKLCTDIRKDSRNTNNTKSLSFGDLFKKDTYKDSAEDVKLYNEYQSKMRNIFTDFQSKNKQANLFSTEALRDSYGTYTENLAEKCAEGDLDIALKKDLPKDLLARAQREMKNTLLSGLDSIESSAKALSPRNTNRSKGLVENQIEHTLKYQPYLFGKILNSPEFKNKEVLSKYICKKSLDIYDSDEWFKVADYGIAATTLVAAVAVNVIPGAGQVASAALITAATTTVVGGAATIGVATAKIVETNNVISSSENALATNQIQLTSATDAIKSAEIDRRWAVAEIGTEVVGAGFLAKGMKGTKATTIATDGVETLTKTKAAAQKTDDIILTGQQAAAKLSETTNASKITKATKARPRDLMDITAKELDLIPTQVSKRAKELETIKETAIEATKKLDDAKVGLKEAEDILKQAKSAKPKLQGPIDDAQKAIVEAKDNLKVAQENAKVAQQTSKVKLASGADELSKVAEDGIQKAKGFLTEALERQGKLTDELATTQRSLDNANSFKEKARLAKAELDELQKKRNILNTMMDDAQVADSGKNYIDDMARIAQLSNEVADYSKKAEDAVILTKLLDQQQNALRLAKQDTVKANKLLQQATKYADETSETIISLTGKAPTRLNTAQKAGINIMGTVAAANLGRAIANNPGSTSSVPEVAEVTESDEPSPIADPVEPSPAPNPAPAPDEPNVEDVSDLKSLLKFNIKNDDCFVKITPNLKEAKEKYADLSCKFTRCKPSEYDEDKDKCKNFKIDNKGEEIDREEKGYYIYPVCKTSKGADAKYKHIEIEKDKYKRILINAAEELVSCKETKPEQMPNIVIPDAAPNVGKPNLMQAPSMPVLIEY